MLRYYYAARCIVALEKYHVKPSPKHYYYIDARTPPIHIALCRRRRMYLFVWNVLQTTATPLSP